MENIKNFDIRAIIFDLFGVLVVKKKKYFKDNLIDKIDGVLGDVIDDDEFKVHIMEKYGIDKFSFDRIFKNISFKYELSELFCEHLPVMKEKYKIAILTNGTKFNSDIILGRVNPDNYFDYFMSSSEVGVRKPDGRIYDLISKELELNPQECVFVDDSKDNIKSAQISGMKTVHWRGSESIKELLKLIDR